MRRGPPRMPCFHNCSKGPRKLSSAVDQGMGGHKRRRGASSCQQRALLGSNSHYGQRRLVGMRESMAYMRPGGNPGLGLWWRRKFEWRSAGVVRRGRGLTASTRPRLATQEGGWFCRGVMKAGRIGELSVWVRQVQPIHHELHQSHPTVKAQILGQCGNVLKKGIPTRQCRAKQGTAAIHEL